MKSIDNSQLFLESSINSQRGAQQQQFAYHKSNDKIKSFITPITQFSGSQVGIQSSYLSSNSKPSEINISNISKAL